MVGRLGSNIWDLLIANPGRHSYRRIFYCEKIFSVASLLMLFLSLGTIVCCLLF